MLHAGSTTAGSTTAGSVLPSSGVLAITRDPALTERLAGLAATAGVTLTHRTELSSGSVVGSQASLVLLGPDADLPGPRRCGVILVCQGDPGAHVWRRAVEVGAEEVAVLPDAEPWLLERIVDAATPSLVAPSIGVIGSRGGAGASTLAVALASAAARCGRRAALIDCDPLGGGLDLLIGLEGDAGLRWPDLASARGRLQPGVLAATLPTADGVWVLSWDRSLPPGGTGAVAGGLPGGGDVDIGPSDPGPGGECPDVPTEAMDAVLHAAAREFDLVVVDLSRRFSGADLAAARACTPVLLVVPAEVRATAAAGRVSALLDHVVADQQLVVRGPAPTGLSADSIADVLGLPLVGELRWEAAVGAAMDRGEPFLRSRGSLSALSRRLVAGVVAA